MNLFYESVFVAEDYKLKRPSTKDGVTAAERLRGSLLNKAYKDLDDPSKRSKAERSYIRNLQANKYGTKGSRKFKDTHKSQKDNSDDE